MLNLRGANTDPPVVLGHGSVRPGYGRAVGLFDDGGPEPMLVELRPTARIGGNRGTSIASEARRDC
jgi:hypothetical protein